MHCCIYLKMLDVVDRNSLIIFILILLPPLLSLHSQFIQLFLTHVEMALKSILILELEKSFNRLHSTLVFIAAVINLV